MHSYLIVGRDKKSVDKKISSIIQGLGSELLEFKVEKISDIRNLNSFTKLKVEMPTTILIKNIDKATNEALNAFLKNLEEPQKNVFYIVTAKTSHNLLPTIVSRCFLIRVNDNLSFESSGDINNFLKINVSKKLERVSQMRTIPEAISFCENIIITSHNSLHKPTADYTQISTLIRAATRTKLALEANGNVCLQLTKLVLQGASNVSWVKL